MPILLSDGNERFVNAVSVLRRGALRLVASSFVSAMEVASIKYKSCSVAAVAIVVYKTSLFLWLKEKRVGVVCRSIDQRKRYRLIDSAVSFFFSSGYSRLQFGQPASTTGFVALAFTDGRARFTLIHYHRHNLVYLFRFCPVQSIK